MKIAFKYLFNQIKFFWQDIFGYSYYDEVWILCRCGQLIGGTFIRETDFDFTCGCSMRWSEDLKNLNRGKAKSVKGLTRRVLFLEEKAVYLVSYKGKTKRGKCYWWAYLDGINEKLLFALDNSAIKHFFKNRRPFLKVAGRTA